jgi:hypothetical protein
VVEPWKPASSEPVFIEAASDLPLTGEDALSESEPKPRAARKRSAGGPRRGRKSAAAPDTEGEKAAPRRSARKSRSKSASE